MYLTIYKKDKPYEIRASDMIRSGVPADYWTVKLANIPSTASHFKDVSGWVAHAREMMNAGIGLFLSGATGQGKTGVAAICAKAARSVGGTVWFSRADEVAGDVVNGAQHPSDDGGDLSDYWQNANLWIVDDLGTALGAEQTRAILEREIRRRLSERRALIITSNQPLDEIMSMAEQTVRAIRGKCKEIVVSGTEFKRAEPKLLEKKFRRIVGE